MAQLYTGSICLTDIPKESIRVANNGKSYLNINIWVNDTKDQYNNDGSICISQSKDERDAKVPRKYIGNIKKPDFKAPAPETPQVEPTDLPF